MNLLHLIPKQRNACPFPLLQPCFSHLLCSICLELILSLSFARVIFVVVSLAVEKGKSSNRGLRLFFRNFVFPSSWKRGKFVT